MRENNQLKKKMILERQPEDPAGTEKDFFALSLKRGKRNRETLQVYAEVYGTVSKEYTSEVTLTALGQ